MVHTQCQAQRQDLGEDSVEHIVGVEEDLSGEHRVGGGIVDVLDDLDGQADADEGGGKGTHHDEAHDGHGAGELLQLAVAYELAVRDQTKRHQQQAIERNDSLEQIIEKITYRNIVSLEETEELMDLATLRRCVDLLHRARVIYLFGMGASFCTAKDAYLKFLRANKLCILNEDWHSQLLQARNATTQDVGIVISYSGATVEMIECMKALKENGTPTIAITRFVKSPVSDLADEKLYTASNESLFRTGAMSSRISQLNIIDILYTALSNLTFDASLDQLSRTYIQKPNVEDGVRKG